MVIDFEGALDSRTGIPISTVNDTLALLCAGFHVILWVSSKSKVEKIENWQREEIRIPQNAVLEVHRTRPRNRIMWISQFLGIKVKVPHSDFFYCSLFPGLKLNNETKRIVRMHDPFSKSMNAWAELTESGARFTLRLANFLRTKALARVISTSTFVFNSEFTQKSAIRIYPNILNFQTIHPIVQFRQPEEFEIKRVNKSNYWLMIGGQRQRKDPASVVNAWASIPELVEGTNMIVVGEIPNNYLHANSIAAIESERLRFISGISSDELRDLIIGSLGTVFNSAGEGWGLPLAESLTCGSPTICNDLPVFKEVCGDNALYFESNDLNSCIEKMIRVSSSSFDREEYFKRATKFASKYQIENIVKQWQQLLIQPK